MPDVGMFTPTKQAESMHALLGGMSAVFLVSDSPLQSSSHLAPAIIERVPPHLQPDYSLLSRPSTEGLKSRGQLESENAELRRELRKAKVTNQVQASINVGAQAQLVLRDLHLDKLTTKLAEKEKPPTENARKRLMSSKTARFMTDPKFRNKVATNEAVVREKAAQKEANKEREGITKRRKEWSDRDLANRKARFQVTLEAWGIENATHLEELKRVGKKEAKRLGLKPPEKPQWRRDFPAGLMPEHLKPRARKQLMASALSGETEEEVIDVDGALVEENEDEDGEGEDDEGAGSDDSGDGGGVVGDSGEERGQSDEETGSE
jgi:hypothetical protein